MNSLESKPDRIARLELEAKGTQRCVTQGEALENLRGMFGLTPGEFANILQIHPGTYQAVIAGREPLPLSATRRAFAIGVPADELLQPPRRPA